MSNGPEFGPSGFAAVLKRAVDILGATIGLGLLLPLIAILALLVLAIEGSPAFHREQRLGRKGILFTIYKIRTMRPDSTRGSGVAAEDDPRITSVGLRLRRWRLDELPQLVNVLLGQMSLVGPRPMPPSHAAVLPREQLDILLTVRPGITDAAAIHFLAEDAELSGLGDAEGIYLQCFLPAKAQMQIDSIKHWSLIGDFRILARTLTLLWSRHNRLASAKAMRNLLKKMTN